ncbi:MAG: fibronectin type III domain-containing protein [bacterium]
MRTTSRAQRGFTLMEVMVALVIMGVVAFGLFKIFTTTNESYKRGVAGIDGQQNVRAALSWMSRELRGAKGFSRIDPDQVTFLSDEHVHNQTRTFRLDSTDRDGDGDRSELLLVRSPNDDGTPGVFTDEIAVGLDSLRFTYRDENGAVTPSRPTVREVEVFVGGKGATGFGESRTQQAHAHEIGMSTRVLCRNLGKSVPTGGDVTPPAVPTGLAVTYGCGTATAHWTPNVDHDLAGYYLFYVRGNSGPPYDGNDAEQGPSPIYVGSAATYTLTGLSMASSYSFALKAVDSADNQSGYSSRVSGTPTDTNPPATPANLTGRVVGTDQVQLDWSASADWDVARYRVTWHDSANPSTIHRDSTTTTTITVGGLTADAVETFKVYAVDGCGNQSAGTPDFVITMVPCDRDVTFPAVPTNVVASQGDGFVRLTWTPVADTDVVGYQVNLHDPVTGSSSTLLVGNVTAYAVHGLQNGSTYQFQVAARDGCGHTGGYSGNIDATPTACSGNTAPPIPPTNLTARDVGNGGTVHVSWSAAQETDALGYKVFWGLAPGTWLGNVDVGSAVSHDVTGLTAGTLYYFSASAYDVCGNESAAATAVSATPSWGCACLPTVNSPTPSDYAVLAGTVPWTATASACSTLAISRVEFQIDGTTRYVDYSAPYEFGDYGVGWTTSLDSDGPHVLVTEAVDANSCSSTDTTRVFVDNRNVGPSCLGLVSGETATVSGTYNTRMGIHALNLSRVDTYHLDKVVVSWSTSGISPQSLILGGVTKWTAAGNPGGTSPDTLALSARTDIPPDGQSLLELVWQKYPTPPPPALDLPNANIVLRFLGAPITSCGPYTVPFAPPCSLAVTVVSVTSSGVYDVIRNPHVGQVYYSDRTYTITSMPTVLSSSTLVRTAQADKNAGDSFQLKLRFYSPVRVYIAYDPRGNPPDWIRNNYTQTSYSIGVTDTGTPTLNLWTKTATAGVSTFYGNRAAGVGGGVATNYVIFVTCQ